MSFSQPLNMENVTAILIDIEDILK